MIAEIVSIGEEILIGQTINTNAAWMASRLNQAGIRVRQVSAVTDEHGEILRSLQEAAARADLVITTGGLGPTRDDITKAALCDFFGTQLKLNESVVEDNRRLFARRGLPLTEMNRLQAMVPASAAVFRNPHGTAPGLWFDHDNKVFVSLPGVPHEMKHMFEADVMPALEKMRAGFHIVHRTILTHGIGESFLAEKIAGWEAGLPGSITLAYLPSPCLVKLRLSGQGTNRKEIEQHIAEAIDSLFDTIPQYIQGTDAQHMEELLAEALKRHHSTLSTAESCTGGYLAHRLTSIPGSSAYFKGSVVAYANQVKEELLGIEARILEQHGAVSEASVEAMAASARSRMKTDYALAISGIAGPEGGTAEKPVGTVWVALATKDRVISKRHLFGNSRERNVQCAAVSAMSLLIKELQNMTTEK